MITNTNKENSNYKQINLNQLNNNTNSNNNIINNNNNNIL